LQATAACALHDTAGREQARSYKQPAFARGDSYSGLRGLFLESFPAPRRGPGVLEEASVRHPREEPVLAKAETGIQDSCDCGERCWAPRPRVREDRLFAEATNMGGASVLFLDGADARAMLRGARTTRGVESSPEST